MKNDLSWKHKIAECFGGSADKLFASQAEERDTALSLAEQLRNSGVHWESFKRETEFWLERELKKGKPSLDAEQKEWIKKQMEEVKKVIKPKLDE